MELEILVNTGSGNGLLPDGTKPLPEPMLTYHQLGPVAFIWGYYHKKIWKYQSEKQDWKLDFFKSQQDLPGDNELNSDTEFFYPISLLIQVNPMVLACWHYFSGRGRFAWLS